MDGTRAGLSQTDWAMILEASDQNSARGAVALERLVKRYWPAVYAFIRATGRNIHEASDLTQDFICDVVLARRLISGADPNRGRFRSLLLAALQNYLRQRHRTESRQRRAGKRVISIDPARSDLLSTQDRGGSTPEAEFAAQWSATLVRQVLDEVRRECLNNDLEAHWTVFDQRVVRPMLLNEPPTNYAVLAAQLGLKEPSQAANMMITVKRRFARAMIAEVARTVRDPDDVEAELHQLLRDLESSS